MLFSAAGPRAGGRMRLRTAFACASLVVLLGAEVQAEAQTDIQTLYRSVCGEAPTAAPATCAALKADIAAATPSAGQPALAWDSSWGPFDGLQGAWWRGPSEVWIVDRQAVQETGLLNRGLNEWRVLAQFSPSGVLAVSSTIRKNGEGQFRVSTTWPRRWSEVTMLTDGVTYFAKQKHAIIRIDENSFEWAPGVLEQGRFRRDPQLATAASGRYTRLSLNEAQAFASQVNQVRHVAAQQQAQRDQERRAAFGQMLAAGVAVAGVAATGGDVNAVPLTGNTLDILSSANAQIGQQNDLSRGRLDGTIAAAEVQQERQRMERERAQAAQERARQPSGLAAASELAARPPAPLSPTRAPAASPSPRQVQASAAPQMCTQAASTREWRPASATLTLDGVMAEYNEARARPCAGGGGSISPLQCDKQSKAMGVVLVGVCKATISCLARQIRCSSQVSPQ